MMSLQKPKAQKIDQDALLKNYKICGNYLKRMGIKEIQEDPEKKSYLIPLKFIFPDELEIKLATIFHVIDKFIMAKCLLLLYDDIKRSRDIDLKLYMLLLRANFELLDVTYSLDNENNVFVEMDIISTANFEAFEDELNGLFHGIEFFFSSIMPEVAEEIKREDTFGRYRYIG